MKINCYQVAPEYQESPLTFDFPEDISVFGNRNFIDSFSDEIEPIMKVLRDSTFTWALNCCESTDERREQLKDWFPEMPDWDDTEIENLTSIIPIVFSHILQAFITKECLSVVLVSLIGITPIILKANGLKMSSSISRSNTGIRVLNGYAKRRMDQISSTPIAVIQKNSVWKSLKNSELIRMILFFTSSLVGNALPNMSSADFFK